MVEKKDVEVESSQTTTFEQKQNYIENVIDAKLNPMPTPKLEPVAKNAPENPVAKKAPENNSKPLWHNLNLDAYKEIEEEKENQQTPEPQPENNVEPTHSTIITTPNYDAIKTVDAGFEFKQKGVRKKSFRKRLSIITASIILTLCAGLITYNAVEISNVNYQVVQYMLKIEQLDNANKLSEGDSLLSSVLPLEQKQLVSPTKTQPQTNWFDGICNFFSNLFGG